MIRSGEEDLLSDGDREAFHNQADRVLDEIDGDYYVLERTDRPKNVRVALATREREETRLIYLTILPRHRFLVKCRATGFREVTTRRDDTVDFIESNL